MPSGDRDLIERHVDRVLIGAHAVEVSLMPGGTAEPTESAEDGWPRSNLAPTILTLPWAAPSFVAVKGIVHEPAAKPAMDPETREALLAAIAKARRWIEDLKVGRAATLVEIADREGLGERHVRLLAPLAFIAPRIVAMIADGTAPAGLTVTGLAKVFPYSWAQQEARL
jgi:hypothetical protein